MSDCELTFKSGKLDIKRCLEKSFLHNIEDCNFKSSNYIEIKKHIKEIMISAVKTERNFFGEEYNIFAEILSYIKWVEANKITELPIYCEVLLR